MKRKKTNSKPEQNLILTGRKKAIGYVRVSTEEQGADNKFGVAVQKKAINEYAKVNGYEIVEMVVEKQSGAKEREKMNEIAFGELCNPPIEAVICYKNDRIARNMKLYFYYFYVLEKKNVKLISVNEEFLNGEDSGIATLYMAMMQFVAEQERKNITMRTSSGRIAKAKEGKYAGGNDPYGYKIKDGMLVPQEEEAKWVKKIFELYDNGRVTIATIETILHDQYPECLGRGGKQIGYTVIRNVILNKPVYQGLYKYSSVGYVLGNHEPLISTVGIEQFLEENEKMLQQLDKEKKGEIYEEDL